MEKDKRADGRALKQLRPLTAEVNVLPPVVHGSAMFARGETMSLCLATLAPMEERQYMDNYTGSVNEKRFILHYNFPPFSVETPAVSAVRTAGKSATALWRNVPSLRSCLANRNFVRHSRLF